MKKLNAHCLVMFVVGVIFMIYGWTQSMEFGADSSVYNQVLLRRTVKEYVFKFSGGILIYLSYVLDLLVNKFRQENDMLAEKIAELKEKLKRES